MHTPSLTLLAWPCSCQPWLQHCLLFLPAFCLRLQNLMHTPSLTPLAWSGSSQPSLQHCLLFLKTVCLLFQNPRQTGTLTLLTSACSCQCNSSTFLRIHPRNPSLTLKSCPSSYLSLPSLHSSLLSSSPPRSLSFFLVSLFSRKELRIQSRILGSLLFFSDPSDGLWFPSSCHQPQLPAPFPVPQTKLFLETHCP